MFRKTVLILSLFIVSQSYLDSVMAERLRGQIRNISRKAQTLELLDYSTGRYRTFTYDNDTRFINARSIIDLFEREKIEIRFVPGKPLESIKKMLVFVPAQKIVKTGELLSIIFGGYQQYRLYDSRPWFEYQKGHLPTATWFSEERFAQYDYILPVKKETPIIVYGDGVTSEAAPQLARLIELQGYTNVRVYVFGFPAWKRFKQPVLVDGDWLIRNLDPHKVIIDVRPREKSLVSHIQNAVSITSEKIVNLGNKYRTTKRGKQIGELYNKRTLPSLSNKDAQIILYGDNTYDQDLMVAYRELLEWKYEDVVILEGGFNKWAATFPIENSPAKTTIRYERYVAEGAISRQKFIAAVADGSAIILDIRTNQEVEKGVVKGAFHIPLTELDIRFKELPKNRQIFIHCVNGIRAQIAYSLLKAEGFGNVGFLNAPIFIKESGEFEIPGS